MAPYHSAIAKITKPLSGLYSSMAGTATQYFGAKEKKLRTAQLIMALSELDAHTLKDIGMEGFDQLSQAQKKRALLNGSKHA